MKCSLNVGTPDYKIQDWIHQPFNFSDADLPGFNFDHYSVEIPIPAGQGGLEVFRQYQEKLFAYQVFPSSRIQFQIFAKTAPTQSLQLDDIIVQHVSMGPLRIECGVKVTNIYDERSPEKIKSGFRYKSLVGHSERGYSDFFLVLNPQTEKLTFHIEPCSRPGVKGVAPIVRLVQKKFTRAALQNFSSPMPAGGRT